MYKVVYNACFGGYGISEKAFNWLKSHNHPDIPKALKEKKVSSQIYTLQNCMKRHDPLLVQYVEELGKDANGDFANLRIEEISGDEYRIHDYDGNETVETPGGMSRSWTPIND